MTKTEKAVRDYLEQYGQPQTWEAIADHLAANGYDKFDRSMAEAMVADGDIAYADGGVDSRDTPITLYAPLSYEG